MSKKIKPIDIEPLGNRIYELRDYVNIYRDIECQKFHKEFKKLPRKMQYYIIWMVKHHIDSEERELKGCLNALDVMIEMLDTACILCYSPTKIKRFVTQIYIPSKFDKKYLADID